ncbi:hypothetical protein Tco_1026943, partial [Tanacetum coccineum]
TDKSKITRKPSNTGKHGHENGRPQEKPKPKKVPMEVFGTMAGFTVFPMPWAPNNPPGYAQPQYDQYYQQYPPPPPQYQEQQQDDDE